MSEVHTTQPVFDGTLASLDVVYGSLRFEADKFRGLLSGDYTSKRFGDGFETDGVREFEYGDDPRYLDYAEMAKDPLNRLWIRRHYRDITPSVAIVTDALTDRYDVPVPGYFSEKQLVLSGVMAAAIIAEQHGMPHALITGDDKLSRNPFKQTRKSLVADAQRLATGLEEAPKEVRLAGLLQQAARVATENVVVVVSDFRDTMPEDENGWKKPLEELVRRSKNQVIAIETVNPWDYALPEEVRSFSLRGANPVTLAGKPGKRAREDYAEVTRVQQATIDTTMRSIGARHIKLDTMRPDWITALHEGLNRRR